MDRRKYNWKLLTNGQIHRLVKGEDFDCSPDGMRKRFQEATRNRGKSARTEVYGNVVYVHASKYNLRDLYNKYNQGEEDG